MQEIIADMLSGALANAGRGKGDHWLTVCHGGTSRSQCVLTASCAPCHGGTMSAFDSHLLLISSLRSKHCYFPRFREEGTKMRTLMELVLEHTTTK